MCQHYISSKKRKCANRGEPYCHLHKTSDELPLTQSASPANSPTREDIPDELPKCLICMEEEPFTIPCNHPICKKCIVFLNKLVCPFCRLDLHPHIDKEMKDYRLHFELLNKKIYDLENDNRAFVNAYNKLEEDYKKLLDEFETMVILSQYFK